jgi:hypothetical protein
VTIPELRTQIAALRLHPVTTRVGTISKPEGARLLSESEADALVAQASRQPLVPTGDGTYEPLNYDQYLNDCEDRAEVAAGFIRGVKPDAVLGKIFISAEPGANVLSMFHDISWTYHVAPYVLVADASSPQGAIRVIDPAIDRERALSLDTWISSATSTADKRGGLLYVHAVGPFWWTYDSELRSPVDSRKEQTSCVQIELAQANLQFFSENRFHRISLLSRARVKSLDVDTGEVTFQDEDGTYGVYAARRDVVRKLKPAMESNQYVTVRLQRLYAPGKNSAFVLARNIWKFLNNDLKTILDVTVKQ